MWPLYFYLPHSIQSLEHTLNKQQKAISVIILFLTFIIYKTTINQGSNGYSKGIIIH